MKKSLFICFIGLLLFTAVHSVNAATATTVFIDENAQWKYDTLATDLWENWAAAGLNSFDWNNATWQEGTAVFGNQSGDYSTFWAVSTDIALIKEFEFSGGVVNSLTLNVGADNGFIIFLNDTLIAKENAGGYASKWEYTITVDTSLLTVGTNTIKVLAEDHGGATYFDMKLSGDVSPVPVPGTMALLGFGLMGLTLASRKNYS